MSYCTDYYAKNKERIRASQRRYESKTGVYARRLNAGKEQRKREPERVYLIRSKARYGLSVEQLDALLEKQGGVCAICRNPTPRFHGTKRKRLCVDHDHTTLKVRGFLCWDCNLALGALHDDPLRAFAAAAYLEAGGVA